jgi:hypothetical protein
VEKRTKTAQGQVNSRFSLLLCDPACLVLKTHPLLRWRSSGEQVFGGIRSVVGCALEYIGRY